MTNAQMPSIQVCWEARDYSNLIKTAEKQDTLTRQEWIFLTQAYYRISEIDKASACIAQLDRMGISEKGVEAIKNDIRSNKFRKVLTDEKYRLEVIEQPENEARYLAMANDSVCLLSVAHQKNIRSGESNAATFGVFSVKGAVEKDSKLTKVIKNAGRHSGPIAPFNDGFFLTENYRKNGERKFLKLSLLDANFRYQKDFIFSNPHYSTGHACFDSIAQRLYFVSDMPKGDGNTDLWYCDILRDGSWTVPKNLGVLNSDGQEMFPSISGGYLYFSSNGRNGFGGLDIYRFNLRQTNATVEHLPAPLNSRYDDFGLHWTKTDMGYLSSNRSENKRDHIYRVQLETGNFGCLKECINESCRNFRIEGLTDLTPDRYAFYWDFGDGNNSDDWFPSHCYSDTGYFDVTLSVLDKVTGYLDSNAMTQKVHIEHLTQNNPSFSVGAVQKSTPFQPIITGTFDRSSPEKALWQSSSGDYTFEREPQFTIDTVGWHWIEQSVKVQQGVTCCYNTYRRYFYVLEAENKGIGQTGENGVVSEQVDLKNANAGSHYSARLSVKGAVQGEPIRIQLTNEIGTILLDTTLFVTEVDLYLQHNRKYQLKVQNVFGVSIEKTLSSFEKTESEYQFPSIELPPLELKGVRFASGSAVITKTSSVVLDELAAILSNNTKMVVELAAHTDALGNTQANKQLSDRRAEAVKRYLIRSGVDKSQLKSIGWGESQIRNGCIDGVECSDGAHSENRRVEVRIIKFKG